MNRVFKTIGGSSVDMLAYSKYMITSNPNVKIIVGTDSQNLSNETVFATVIAYRLGNRGVHIIYQKKKDPLIKDIYTRLLMEVQLSIETAEMLKNNGPIHVDAIDLDLNSNTSYKSHSIVSSAVGWCTGLGYKCVIKPDAQIAAKAADMLCH